MPVIREGALDPSLATRPGGRAATYGDSRESDACRLGRVGASPVQPALDGPRASERHRSMEPAADPVPATASGAARKPLRSAWHLDPGSVLPLQRSPHGGSTHRPNVKPSRLCGFWILDPWATERAASPESQRSKTCAISSRPVCSSTTTAKSCASRIPSSAAKSRFCTTTRASPCGHRSHAYSASVALRFVPTKASDALARVSPDRSGA